MIRQLPVATVDAVVDYAHRKAAYFFYDDLEELQNTINTLTYVQNHSSAYLDEELRVPLAFSFGYEVSEKPSDYKVMIKCADEKMYDNKRKRKNS